MLHLKDLGGSGEAATLRASVMLRLFKLLFMAVTIFPEFNETVLQPHCATLILSSMQLASCAAEPINYYLLLRALFRNIGGGRYFRPFSVTHANSCLDLNCYTRKYCRYCRAC